MDQRLQHEQSDASLHARIEAFSDGLVPGLYHPREMVDWSRVDSALVDWRDEIQSLQEIVDRGRVGTDSLARAVREIPRFLDLVRVLIAAPRESGFVDGRILPHDAPKGHRESLVVARLLRDIGLPRILQKGSRVEDLVRVALINSLARRRRFQRTSMDIELASVVAEAAHDAGLATGRDVRADATGGVMSRWSGLRRAAYVVWLEDRPVAAVETVFEVTGGGRQNRNLSFDLPAVQAEIDGIPAWLVVVADGPGIRAVPPHVFETLFTSVASVMNLSQVRSGALKRTLIEAVRSEGRRRGATAPLEQLIESGLNAGVRVTASDLPAPEDAARLALAAYRRARPDQALMLDASGTALEWERGELVKAGLSLMDDFDTDRATGILARILGRVDHIRDLPSPPASKAVFLSDGGALPEALFLTARSEAPSAEDLRDVSRLALATVPEGRLAFLVTPETEEVAALKGDPQFQSRLAANVVLLTPRDLIAITQASRGLRASLMLFVLAQADLTKASPFVLTNAAPYRVFFGRETERAEIMAAVDSSSVAVLGGRRIGKTSLLLHVQEALRDAGYAPYYADCQTVKTWEDFALLAQLEWNVSTPSDFHPTHLLQLMDALAAQGQAPPVVLLDEIDQLLEWDRAQRVDEVNEPFFRACRTASQEGRAQFIFTGERMIAEAMWDARSPHWNFCRLQMLRQLSHESTEQLLHLPFQRMQVEILEPEEFHAAAWRVTGGHPQIAQFLGDRLVRRLNDRSPTERTWLGPSDLWAVADSSEYREHYLATYWGQATPLEQLLSVYAVTQPVAIGMAARRLTDAGVQRVDEREIARSLRMLQLYGIVDITPGGYALRIPWFIDALADYGSITELESRFAERV